MESATTGAVVLAAGRGTRMGSSLPKVLHCVNGLPMIAYVLSTLEELGFGSSAPPPVVVVGFGEARVRSETGDRASFVTQLDQRGTGDAARVGLDALPGSITDVLLIHGDEPLIETATYRRMLERRHRTGAAIVLLTGYVSDTHQLGRVIRNAAGEIVGLVQEQDLTDDQRETNEINFGAYVFDRPFMQGALPRLPVRTGGEYHLTDLVAEAVRQNLGVESVPVPEPDAQMGINDQEGLERAEQFLRRKAS